MTVREISTLFQAGLQDGQLVLTPETVSAFPLGDVFSLLETEAFRLREATVTALDNSVTLAAKAALLGSPEAGVTFTFTEDADVITFDFAATLPAGQLPGAAWLTVADLQIGLQVVGRGSAVTGTFGGSIQAGSTRLETTIGIGRIDGRYQLDWQIAELDLLAIAPLFLEGVSIPEEVPNLAFANIHAQLFPSSGEFSLRAETASALAFPASGGGLTISQASIAIARVVTDDSPEPLLNATLEISGDNTVEIVPDLTLGGFDLSFELAGSDWTAAGSLTAAVFDQLFMLSASYEQAAEMRSLMFDAAAEDLRELINLGGSGSLGVTGLTLAYMRPTAAAGEPAAAADWSLAASGRIAVEGVFDFAGLLTLQRTATDSSLVFMPEQADVTLPLPPSGSASMTLAFGEIAFVRRQLPTAPGTSWMFEAAAALAFQGWHPEVQARLPEQINATFRATNEAVRLTADRVLAPFDYDIPDIEIEDLRIPLGAARIDLSDLSIQLGQEILLSARIGVGLPENLNNLFGVSDDGTPAIDFFNTFNPADPENTTVELELAIDATGGIRVIPRSTFLNAVRLVEENGESFWYLDFNAFGEVKFRAPIFSYDAAQSSFRASGGFEVVRPLTLPLTPAKLLLNAVGLSGAADLLPDGLPLQEVSLLDAQNNFRTEEIVALLEGVSDGALPDEVGEALNAIGDRLEQLPDSFRQYLNIQIPDSFHFDIAVTPSGEVRITAGVNEGDPPVRLLYPTFTPVPVPIPSLNGVELRSLSFGTFSGGSLFLLEVDAVLDQFDLLTLAGALLLPETDALPLPDPRELHRRLILNKLFMLVVYQTGIPIPIPLFYDEIGIEYLGLEGINFETHAQFPEPSLNLAEVGEIVSDLRRFFTDRDFLLDPNQPPEDFNLRFTWPLPTNFLQLPEYMGAQRLGSTASGLEIDAYRNLAHLLNGLKTFSLNQLIQAAPLEHRVNSAQVDFGPVRLNAGWLITTPGEFQQLAARPADRQRVYDQLGFANEAEAAATLAIAPTSSTSEEGLVALLRGGWDVANVGMFDAAFGLAASGSLGFGTGFRIAGEISNLLALELAGRVAINAPSAAAAAGSSPAFQLAGHSQLSLLNRQIFAGDVQIVDDNFWCRGQLSLFPSESPLQVNGQLEGQLSPSQFFLNGDVSTALAGVELAGARVMLDNQRLYLQGNWLGVATTLDVAARNQAVVLQGTVDVNLWGLQANLAVEIDSASGASAQGSIRGINLLNGAFRLSGANGQPNPSAALIISPTQPLSASLSGSVSLLGITSTTQIAVAEDRFSFTTSGQLFNRFGCSLTASGRQLTSAPDFSVAGQMQNDLLQYLNRETSRLIQTAVNDATADIRAAEQEVAAARAEVNRINQSIATQRAIVRGERSAANRRLQDAQNAVNSAQQQVNSLNSQIRNLERQRDREAGRQSCTNFPFVGRRCVPDPRGVANAARLQAQITGLQATRGSAIAALEAARQTLRLVQRGVVNTPIDADPRVAGQIVARETANGVLIAAQRSLEVTRAGLGGFAEVSDFITQNGLGSLLDVRTASFETRLNAAADGTLALTLSLVYLGRSQTLSVSFDFNNPLNGARALAERLLPN
ncbi:MAG: hypothetical protein F6J97_03030 [Leptolyngbya sp. SIO4C1]|nr:hypothetical protein [Leptolyngbya sp. SIO4C1]